MLHFLLKIIEIYALLSVCWVIGGPVRWLAYAGVSLPLWLLGFPLVGFATWRKAYSHYKSLYYPPREIMGWNWDWMWLWGNDENGIDAMSPVDQLGSSYTGFWRIFYWSAIKNPQDNLKYVEGLNPYLMPSQIKGHGNCQDVDVAAAANPSGTFWTYTTMGKFAGFHAYWLKHIWRIGWKLKPTDAQRTFSTIPIGFALQCRHET